MKGYLFACLWVFLAAVACSGEGLDETLQISINDQEYTCNENTGDSTQPPSSDTSEDFCDRTGCQVVVTNKSLILKKENPEATAAGLWCTFIQDPEFLACTVEVLEGTCVENDPEDFDKVIGELVDQVNFFQENCMCVNSAELNPDCETVDPCEKGLPCLNGGTCISNPRGRPWGRSHSRKSFLEELLEELNNDRHRRGVPWGVPWGDTGNAFKCRCPRGFTGDFCQNCESCKTCRKFDKCNCPSGYGGPSCTLTCESIEESKRELYQACLQVTMDDYYALSFPSQCFLNFEMGQCIAATAQNCGFDVADVGDEAHFKYWITAVVDVAEFLLVNGGCAIFGEIPQIR